VIRLGGVGLFLFRKDLIFKGFNKFGVVFCQNAT